MRLRYLHLPLCGPLRDVAVVFGQEPMLFGRSADRPAGRVGAINFVVGVNGTGKSSLLRALYRIFRDLKSRRFPPMPCTLAWDWDGGNKPVTAVFHHPGDGEAESLFMAVDRLCSHTGRADWQAKVRELAALSGKNSPDKAVGPDVPPSSYLQAHLPRRVLAYTSGDETLWDWIEAQDLQQPPTSDSAESREADRPRCWSIEREWEEERPVRIANVLTAYETKRAQEVARIPGAGSLVSLGGDVGRQLMEEMQPLNQLGEKVLANHLLRSRRDPDPCFRVCPFDIRLAGITLAVSETARELNGKDQDFSINAFRSDLLQQMENQRPASDIPRVLNELDWFHATHISITYRDAEDRVSKRQHEQLVCLCALADEVIAQPLGRCQAVISLGPCEPIDLKQRIENVTEYGIPNANIDSMAARVHGCRTGAEAVLRLFSEAKDLTATSNDFFDALRAWRESGLLEDITLTIRRVHQPAGHDGQPDDVIVTFDQLSDGEQALLGRVGLFYLLRGQNDSLLLLDEPETHFNDLWKREMVDLIDDAILKTTRAQVIVATHTSIALTDVFASEVVLLRRNPKTGEFYEAKEPIETFGASPNDILRDIFQADEIIGRRAAEFLDLVLIVAANPTEAAAVWNSGQFAGPELDELWQAAQTTKHAFSDKKYFNELLHTVWTYTRAQPKVTANPEVLDTLRAIGKKLGPGHYRFEFDRRIHALESRNRASQG